VSARWWVPPERKPLRVPLGKRVLRDKRVPLGKRAPHGKRVTSGKRRAPLGKPVRRIGPGRMIGMWRKRSSEIITSVRSRRWSRKVEYSSEQCFKSNSFYSIPLGLALVI